MDGLELPVGLKEEEDAHVRKRIRPSQARARAHHVKGGGEDVGLQLVSAHHGHAPPRG